MGKYTEQNRIEKNLFLMNFTAVRSPNRHYRYLDSNSDISAGGFIQISPDSLSVRDKRRVAIKHRARANHPRRNLTQARGSNMLSYDCEHTALNVGIEC